MDENFDDLTLEEIQKRKAEFNINEEQPTPEETEEVEEKTEEENKEPEGEETQEPVEVQEEAEKPEQEQAPEAPQGQAEDKVQLIDDDFIAKQPEADRKILSNFKGNMATPNMIKTLIHQARMIGKKTIATQESRTELDKIAKNPPAIQNVPTTVNEVPQFIEAEVQKQLKQKYPELPDDPKERRTYLNEKNVEDGEYVREVHRAEEEIKQGVKQQVEQVQYVQTNANKINSDLIDSQLDTIRNYVSQFGLDPKEDLGIDLSDEKDIKSLMQNDNEEWDMSLVTHVGNTAILKDNALLLKFMGKYLPNVGEKLKAKNAAELEAAVKKARKEGFESANKKQPNSTLASTKIGKQEEIELTDEMIDNAGSLEEIEKLKSMTLNKMKLKA